MRRPRDAVSRSVAKTEGRFEHLKPAASAKLTAAIDFAIRAGAYTMAECVASSLCDLDEPLGIRQGGDVPAKAKTAKVAAKRTATGSAGFRSGLPRPTYRPLLAQDANGHEDIDDQKENDGHRGPQCGESEEPRRVQSLRRRPEVVGDLERGIAGDAVSGMSLRLSGPLSILCGPDEEHDGRDEEEGEGANAAVLDVLQSQEGKPEEDPKEGRDQARMESREPDEGGAGLIDDGASSQQLEDAGEAVEPVQKGKFALADPGRTSGVSDHTDWPLLDARGHAACCPPSQEQGNYGAHAAHDHVGHIAGRPAGVG
jgi:hypothetical protein